MGVEFFPKGVIFLHTGTNLLPASLNFYIDQNFHQHGAFLHYGPNFFTAVTNLWPRVK